MDLDDRELLCRTLSLTFDFKSLILMLSSTLGLSSARGLLLFEFVCLSKECSLDAGRSLLT